MQRLQELLDELEQLRGSDGEVRAQNYGRVLESARRLEGVPLVHGVSERTDLGELARTRSLSSRASRGLAARKVEEYLGIEERVYASAGILYPDARMALVFRPEVERPGTDASPWDSGLFARKLCPDLPPMPDPGRRGVFQRYTLPAPHYREYLVCYVASCYWQPWDYLDPHQRHAFTDPLGALCEHPRSRSFEVRIPDGIELSQDALLAVFLLGKGAMPRTVTDWLQHLARAGVVIKQQHGSSRYLERLVREWISAHLGYGEA